MATYTSEKHYTLVESHEAVYAMSGLGSQQSCLKQTTKQSSCSSLSGGLTSLSTIKGISEELFLPNPWKMKSVHFWAPDTQQAEVRPVCPPRSTWELASVSCSPQLGHSAAFCSGSTLNCCTAAVISNRQQLTKAEARSSEACCSTS